METVYKSLTVVDAVDIDKEVTGQFYIFKHKLLSQTWISFAEKKKIFFCLFNSYVP